MAAAIHAGAPPPPALIKVRMMERFGWTPRQWREDVDVRSFLEIMAVDDMTAKVKARRGNSRH